MNPTDTQPLPITIAVTAVAEGKAKAKYDAQAIVAPKAIGLPTPAETAIGTIMV